MLDYAPRPSHRHERHPVTLGLIVAGHAAALFAVISAKMDLPVPWHPTDTTVVFLPQPPDPPPPPPEHKAQPTEKPLVVSNISEPPKKVVIPLDTGPVSVPGPTFPTFDPVPPGPVAQPTPQPQPRALPVRKAAVLATSGDDLKPPYPDSMRRAEKEATLQLRLSIDDQGRVTAVEPIGPAEPAFLDAARRQILSRWHYRPALEDGRPVPTSITVRLSFRLEDA